ncbi:hypothetical protein CYMTET_11109 [Cymbomonas tetramitiformis]|uniref:Uncharacterized protein n=1 Tax=Cymbomonas tetramitiformis TaxID=36881 RepID=A0AAE0GMS0_9CHLO|nr:hypothetical protein CYMTET_11109 [Cymbomonas tetramitiformis]
MQPAFTAASEAVLAPILANRRRRSCDNSMGTLGAIDEILPDILKLLSVGQCFMFASVNKWAFRLVNGRNRQLLVGSYARGRLLHAPGLYCPRENSRFGVRWGHPNRNGAAFQRELELRVNLAEYLSLSSTLTLERMLRCDRYSKNHLLRLTQVYASPRIMRALAENRTTRPPLHLFSLGYLASVEAIEDESEMREATFVVRHLRACGYFDICGLSERRHRLTEAVCAEQVYRWCLESDDPLTAANSDEGSPSPSSESELALRSRDGMLGEVARRILAAAPVQRNSYESAAPAGYADPLFETFVMIGARSTKALTIFEVARRAVMTTTRTSRFGLNVLRDSPRDFATAAFIGACSSANIEVIIALRDRYRLSTRPELITDFAATRHDHSDFDFVRRAAEVLIAADLNFAETTSTLRLLWNLTLAAETTEEASDRGGLGDALLTSTLLSSASPSVILWYLENLRVPLRWGDHRDLLRNSKLVFGDRSDELVDELWRRLVTDVADGDRRTGRFRDVIDLMPSMTTLNRFLRSWMRLNKLEKLPDVESAASLNRLRDLILSPSERLSFCYLDTAGAYEYGFFEGEAFSEFRQLFDLLAVARILGIERASHSAFANRLRHPYTLQIAETIPLDGMLEKLAETIRGARSGKYLLLIAPELAAFLRTHRTRSTNLSDRYHRNLSALQSIDKSNVPSFPVRNAENPTTNR